MATKAATQPTHNGAALKTFSTRNDLPADARQKLIKLLNQQLADTTDLRTQTKHAHWNVKGPNFIALHKLFDELAEQLSEFADEIAERATALGGVATGTARVVAANSRVPEFPGKISPCGSWRLTSPTASSGKLRDDPAYWEGEASAELGLRRLGGSLALPN